jgi:transcriptional regulator with XRE-family HTH domain
MEQETARILENIRKKRLARQVSVLNLANIVGISHSHLFYIESKRVIPSVDVLVKIAKALHVPLVDLLNGGNGQGGNGGYSVQ